MDQGSEVALISGYQLITMRTIINSEDSDSTGRSSSESSPAVCESSAARSNAACPATDGSTAASTAAAASAASTGSAPAVKLDFLRGCPAAKGRLADVPATAGRAGDVIKLRAEDAVDARIVAIDAGEPMNGWCLTFSIL